MLFTLFLVASAQVPDAPSLPTAACSTAHPCATLDAREMLALAQKTAARGDIARAQALLIALTRDPDPDIRAEARFRLGQMSEARRDFGGAERWYRALLDEKPDAAAVRLALGRVLAGQDKIGAAGRELRRAQATGLPPEVAKSVERVTSVLRSKAPFGGSIEIALAPDSNVNRATRSQTVDAFGLPFQLSSDAREKSGIGVATSSQVFVRQPLSGPHKISAQLAAVGTFYTNPDFSDLTLSLSAGPEFALGRLSLRPAAIVSKAWYGGKSLSNSYGGTVMARAAVGKTTALALSGNVQHNDYAVQKAQSGETYSGQLSIEKALSARLYARVSTSVIRNDARESPNAYWSYGSGVTISRQFGKLTGYAGVNYRRLESDAAFFLFGGKRDDDFVEANLGVIVRPVSFYGLSPVVRLSHTRNNSALTLYDYTRNRIEVGVTKDF